MTFNFSTLDAVALGTILTPLFAQLFKLPIHFESTTLPDSKKINNAFAVVFSSFTYIYTNYTHPYTLSLHFNWFFFFIISILCFILVLTLRVYFNKSIDNPSGKIIIILHSVLYVTLFVSLTTGIGLVNLKKTYYYIDGVVEKDDKLLANCSILGSSLTETQSGKEFLLVFKANSDQKGKYTIVVNKDIDNSSCLKIDIRKNDTLLNTERIDPKISSLPVILRRITIYGSN